MSDYNDQPLHRLEPAYLDHYGLKEPPFSAMVDERFYFSTAESSQRLNMLVHMTQYSDMVLMVLGEEGMGKSTLLQSYLKSAHDNWHICRINANSMMDKDQLLFRIAEDFGLQSLPSDSAELQEMLYDKLIQLHQNDVLPVIIIDDAHELAVDAINQLFIMAEIKAGDVTMVHIVLFAEPKINKIINASNARKICERIGHTFEIEPFDEADTSEYILNRLTVSGLQDENPFSAKVIRQIHKQSQGNPARINELAHVALDEAQGGNEPEYEEPEEFEIKSAGLFTPLRVIAVLAIATIAGLGLWQQDRINQIFETPSQVAVSDVEPEVAKIPSPADRDESPFARLKEKMIDLKAAKKELPAASGQTPPRLDQIEDPAIAAQLQQTEQAPLPPRLERIEPASLTAGEHKQTLTLFGKNFGPDTRVRVSWAGNKKTLPASRIQLDSENKMRIEIITGTQADNWTVTISNADGKSSSAGFKVVAAKPTTQTAEQWVQAQPAQNLSLQLLGSHSMKPIQKYIEQYMLADQARVYKTTHDNKDWYVLLYGSFNSTQQAQQVIEHLPPGARNNKPWIRKFASIRAQKKASPKKSTAVVTTKAKAPRLDNIKAHEAWLWSQDPSHFTLQLLGTQSVNNIKQFIRRHKLHGKVVYYHTQRDNHDWYALLYGVYPTNQDAKTAVAALPTPIKKLSPWVRSFSAIHTEMGTPDRQ